VCAAHRQASTVAYKTPVRTGKVTVLSAGDPRERLRDRSDLAMVQPIANERSDIEFALGGGFGDDETM